MVVYKFTCLASGNVYIGKTIQDFELYVKTHFRSAENGYDLKEGRTPRAFYNAIRLHGRENFTYEILCECSSKDELNAMEIYYIELYDSYNNGYNMTKGGDGGGGGIYDRTPEIRDKIALSLKGHKRSQESIEKQRTTISGENHPLYNVGHSQESIDKMSTNSRGTRNAASCRWKITSPDGTVYDLVGGYHDFLKEHGLSRWSMDKVYKGEKDNYKGWRVEKLPS